MGLRTPLATFALAIGSVWLWPAYGQSEVRARVSFDEGGTVLRGSNDADWSYATTNTIVMPGDNLWVREQGSAEIELNAGNYLRMADGSNVEIESLAPSGSVRLATGSVYLHRLARSTGEVILHTPAGTVGLMPNSCARIDVLDNGGATVSVRWGAADVRVGSSGYQRVADSQRVYIEPGYLPSRPVAFQLGYDDDFDLWNRDRGEFIAMGVTSIPTSVAISDSTIGYGELSHYGEWDYIDGRNYWRPTYVSDYVPYRHGHWSYVRNVGNCWVDDHPFGYITSHHGRWNYLPRYGWCWSYDPVWSPAWCATMRYGDNFMWTPIDYYNRPVTSVGATFDIGGVAFSFAATSFVPQNHLYYGGSYIAPVRPQIVQNINVTNINIWNIYDDDNRHFAANDFLRGKNFREYHHRPDRIVRGPVQLARSDRNARDIAATLERERKPKARGEAKLTANAKESPTPDKVQRERRQVKLDAEAKQAEPVIASEAPADREARRQAREKRNRDAAGDMAEKDRLNRDPKEGDQGAKDRADQAVRDRTARDRAAEDATKEKQRGRGQADVTMRDRENERVRAEQTEKERTDAIARDRDNRNRDNERARATQTEKERTEAIARERDNRNRDNERVRAEQAEKNRTESAARERDNRNREIQAKRAEQDAKERTNAAARQQKDRERAEARERTEAKARAKDASQKAADNVRREQQQQESARRAEQATRERDYQPKAAQPRVYRQPAQSRAQQQMRKSEPAPQPRVNPPQAAQQKRKAEPRESVERQQQGRGDTTPRGQDNSPRNNERQNRDRG